MMAVVLSSIAEVSNVLTVFIVLTCLFIMLGFIFRLRGETLFQMSSVHWVHNPRMAQSMVLVHNPFIFRIHNSKDSSLSSIECNFSSQIPWILQVFWAVSINDLHRSLNNSWPFIKEKIQDDTFLQGNCLQRGIVEKKEPCQNSVITLVPERSILESDLCSNPRTKYPLVVFQLRESDLKETDDVNTVVAMISIVHIKDSLCLMETCILSQYLKQGNGQTCPLKQLYISSDSNTTAEESYRTDNNDDEEIQEDSLCVVCQTLPVSRALLPCRHTCVCCQCFPRLDKCPICRGHIRSYFSIRDEGPLNVQEEREEVIWESLTWGQRLRWMNERLNDWFGFT